MEVSAVIFSIISSFVLSALGAFLMAAARVTGSKSDKWAGLTMIIFGSAVFLSMFAMLEVTIK